MFVVLSNSSFLIEKGSLLLSTSSSLSESIELDVDEMSLSSFVRLRTFQAPGRLSSSSDSLSDEEEEEEWSLSSVARCSLDDEEEEISMHSTSALSLPEELWLSSSD